MPGNYICVVARHSGLHVNDPHRCQTFPALPVWNRSTVINVKLQSTNDSILCAINNGCAQRFRILQY
jgi:hypothetical protein